MQQALVRAGAMRAEADGVFGPLGSDHGPGVAIAEQRDRARHDPAGPADVVGLQHRGQHAGLLGQPGPVPGGDGDRALAGGLLVVLAVLRGRWSGAR